MDESKAPVSALFTDLYELTMVQAYWQEAMTAPAVFSLYYRTLPATRNFLVACGLAEVLAALEAFRFTGEEIDWLASTGLFRSDFLTWLSRLTFTGRVRAVPEGTPLFPEEPILEVEAPMPEAQIVETLVINQVNVAMLIASKAVRILAAADGRPVLDFGSRRAHGIDAANKAARAAYAMGMAGTSNVLAGRLYGIPLSGTMAHSYVAAADSETEAFRTFARLYPDTTLLVDTYEPLAAVDKIVRLAGEMGDAFSVRAIRIDSGDLAALARQARARLDAGGLGGVRIIASGGLDEHGIAGLVASGAPIDGFGVGTALATSSDAAQVDVSYKLSAYAGTGRVKLAEGKRHLAGPKQVFRTEEDGTAAGDVLAGADERLPGRPLLAPVMEGGRILPGAVDDLETIRARTADELARLPARLLSLGTDHTYPLAVSEALEAESARLAARFRGD